MEQPRASAVCGCEFCGGKRVPRGDVREAHQGMHQGQLPRVIELQTRDALAVRQDGGLAEVPQLTAIDEGFQDVLLNIQIVVHNRGELLTELRKVVNGFFHGVVSNIVGGGLGAKQEMITNILFDEPVAIVTTDDWIGQMQIFNYGLQLSWISGGDFAAKDHRDFIRLTDGAVGIQKALTQLIERGSPTKDQVVTILHPREEQAMLASGVFPLAFGEEGSETGQPLLATVQQIAGAQGVGEFLEPVGMTAFQEGVGALLEVDVLLLELMGQPVMLVQADARREGEVGTQADEHAAPVSIVHVEVVLHHPALGDLQMPAVVLLVSDGNQNARRFSCFQDGHDLVRLGFSKVGLDEIVASALGSFQNWRTPPFRTILDPVLKLPSDVAQNVPADRIQLAIAVEETDYPLGLLKGLDQAVQENTVEAPIAEADVILVMVVEGVHDYLQCGEIPGE